GRRRPHAPNRAAASADLRPATSRPGQRRERDDDMTGDEPPATVWGPAGMSRGAADRRRLTASFDLMAAVLNGTALPSLLKLVAERARSMAGVPLAFIALPAEEAHTLRI